MIIKDGDGRERNYLAISEHLDLKYTDFAAFSYAEAGAMGCPGELKILTRDGQWYKDNFCFGNISGKDIYTIFPPLEKMNADGFGGVRNVPDGFFYVCLGMGNHLLVNTEIGSKSRNELCSLEWGECYRAYQGILDSALSDSNRE